MRLICLILFSLILITTNGQDWGTPKLTDSSWDVEQKYSINHKKKNILLISKASLYTASLYTLNKLWYSNYPRSNFHFINDNKEWLQMDKAGHISVSYYSGVAGIKAYEWAGFSRKNAIWFGGMTGSFFLTIIEALDGTSSEWGASYGDLIANTTGSLICIFQALKWNEQRILLKYSYFPSEFAYENPDQLGYTHLERSLKDYNGQTYWISFNLKSIFNINHDNFPRWLCFSLGYGGDYMINPNQVNDDRSRQYYLSFDVDLTKLNVRNKLINSIFHTFGFLKFPAPAFELTRNNISFHPIFY